MIIIYIQFLLGFYLNWFSKLGNQLRIVSHCGTCEENSDFMDFGVQKAFENMFYLSKAPANRIETFLWKTEQ